MTWNQQFSALIDDMKGLIRVKPIPFVPDSTVLDFAEIPPGHSRRLELWNLTEGASLDYICLSLVPDQDHAPRAMITTRLNRTSDNALDAATGPARAVPAAQQSILTIPLDTWMADSSNRAERLGVTEKLLADLAAGQAPWLSATCLIDDTPVTWWTLRWSDGILWAGEHHDATASVIIYGPASDELRLRTLALAEKRELSQ